jgi:hypothetical protein
MNITGSLLSSWWHSRIPKDDVPAPEPAAEEVEGLKADMT